MCSSRITVSNITSLLSETMKNFNVFHKRQPVVRLMNLYA